MHKKRHRQYDERQMTALLERAAQLQGGSAMVPVQNNRTLDEIKAIAGEAGMDAAAVEAAALELGAPESDSLPLIGRSPRMEMTCAVEGALDEEDRRELVAILQRALDAGGRTRETLRTLEWRHFGLLGRELVVVTARKGTTTIEVRGRYRRGLVATFLAGGFPAGLATAGLLDFANILEILDGAAVPLVLGAAFFVGRTVWNWYAAAKERTLRRLAARIADFAENAPRALPPAPDDEA